MKKLSLNKETIVQLGSDEVKQVKAGVAIGAWGKCNATYNCNIETGGCTDMCGIFATMYHCTDGHCTRDCTTGMTVTSEKEVTSGN